MINNQAMGMSILLLCYLCYYMFYSRIKSIYMYVICVHTFPNHSLVYNDILVLSLQNKNKLNEP